MSILAQSAPKAQVPAGASAPEFQASREGYKSLATLVGPGILPLKAGEVQPLFFRLARMTGFRPVRGGGMWLNCQFEYQKPGGMAYVIEAACEFDHLACGTGGVYVRSCSCPDGLMRVGQKGEMRKCKHMLALAAHVAGRAGAKAAVETEAETFRRAKGWAVEAPSQADVDSYQDQLAGACE